LAREIGRGAFLDRRRDFLHAGGARVGGEHGARGDHAVNDGENAASNDQVKHYGHNGIVPVRLVELAGIGVSARGTSKVPLPNSPKA
jgi:hypothetical protein